MNEFNDLPPTFRVEKISEILGINLNAAYEIAKLPGLSIRVGKRLIVIRDGFLKWLESEMQKNKNDVA